MDDPVVAWITRRTHDAQGVIASRAAQHGHTLGAWAYVGGDGIYRHEGRTCGLCGRRTAMGMRQGHQPKPERYCMAVWGAALEQECSGSLLHDSPLP